MKKLISIMLSTLLAMSTAACSSGSAGTASSGAAAGGASAAVSAPSSAAAASSAAAQAGGKKKAGVCWYQFSDTFIANARQSLLNIAQSDGKISVADADSTNDQNVQANNMNNFFSQKVDYLVLNNINMGGISNIVDQCKQKGVTAIFANTTSPADKDFSNYDKLWYVSSDSRQSGTNMGNAIAEYIKAHPTTWDRNHYGKLDFVLLQGIASFSDTINRSSYSLAAIEGAGTKLGKCIGGDDVTGVKGGDSVNGVICGFSRAKAQENVEALLANYGKDIDCVIADNDDEALGAIAALKAHGYFTNESNTIPVVGVDATAAGCEALKNGTMLETSLNNPVKLSKCVYKVMSLLNDGKEVNTQSLGIDGAKVEGHRVWIDYTSITAKNISDASYDIKDTKIN